MLTAKSLGVLETLDYVTVKGNGFEIPFSKESGLIRNATSNGNIIIENGTFMHLDINLNHLSGAEVRKSADNFLIDYADWKKETFGYEKTPDRVVLSLTGAYKNVDVRMQFTVFSEGRLEISYLTDGEPNGNLRETRLSFHIPQSVNHLKWKRKGYWSVYPEDDFAGNVGNISLFESRQTAYGEEPEQP